MDIGTITTIRRPQSAEEIAGWRPSYAWLAGGTWLFSEPQPDTDTLIDLHGLGWPALQAAAGRARHRRHLPHRRRCTASQRPADWAAAPLFRSLLQGASWPSFKIWNAATVGGNHLHVAAGRADDLADRGAGGHLHAVAARRRRRGRWPSIDFVTGNHANVLQPGELLRSIHLPASALSRQAALRSVDCR